jgi:Ca2+-transporting ATPase
VEAGVTLGVFIWGLRHSDVGQARDLAFNTLVFSELFRAFAARSPDKLFWQVGIFNNLRLVGVVVVSALIQIGIHQIPAAARLFHIQDLPLETRALPFLLALIPVSVLELRKVLRRPA